MYLYFYELILFLANFLKKFYKIYFIVFSKNDEKVNFYYIN